MLGSGLAMRRRSRLRLVAIALVVTLVTVARPEAVAACNGEPLRAQEIASSAQAVVLVAVTAVGPNHAENVPGSFILRVERVLYGSAPPEIRMTWPTPINICDGYVATLGDRFFMALGVGEFSPIWPIQVAHRTGAERSDLLEVLALLRKAPQQPARSDLTPAAVFVLVAGTFLGAAALVIRRRDGFRIRHGQNDRDAPAGPEEPPLLG